MSKYHIQEIELNGESSHAKLLKLVGTNKKVLEMGCATGYVSKMMKEKLNCYVTGIEIDPDAAKEAEKHCEKVIVGDIEEMDFSTTLGKERFDVITFGDVLEHLNDPSKILKALYPFLVDDGYILASIPNIAHISVALELLEGKFEYRSLGLLDDTHIRFFTKKSILSLFRKAGYEIVFWDRVIVRPEDTEFQTALESYPYSLLSFFEAGNECLTYQFIVKAIPYALNRNLEELQSEWKNTILQELRDKLADKERQMRDIKRELDDKKRELETVYNSYSWRITAPLRWLNKHLRKEGK